MKEVDARGLSCPQPVIMAKNALSLGEDAIDILVDNEVSKENVTRFATNQGYQVEVEKQDDEFRLHIRK